MKVKVHLVTIFDLCRCTYVHQLAQLVVLRCAPLPRPALPFGRGRAGETFVHL